MSGSDQYTNYMHNTNINIIRASYAANISTSTQLYTSNINTTATTTSNNINIITTNSSAASSMSSMNNPSSDNNILQCPDARLKAAILTHPLFEQLLDAHVACLRVSTPIQNAQDIDTALLNVHTAASKYLGLPLQHDTDELDDFMVNYIMLLRSLKEYLQEHVSTQASEAISACWELEHALQDLTGAVLSSSERNSELMMPHDEQQILNADQALATLASTFGTSSTNPTDNYSLPPIDDDRAMVSHVRRELKRELKEDYLAKLKNMHDLIVRKARRSSKPNEIVPEDVE